MVIGTFTVVPGTAVFSAETVSLPTALTTARTWFEDVPPEYACRFLSPCGSSAERVNAVRSMTVAPSPAATSMTDEENVGAGVSRPTTVIGSVSTAVLTILAVPSLDALPSTAVKVMDAGPV